MTDPKELYDLIFPEVLKIPHALQLHKGLADLGVEDFQEALAGGYLLLARARDGEPAILIHEDELVEFERLVTEVGLIRREQRILLENQARLEAERFDEERFSSLCEDIRERDELGVEEALWLKEVLEGREGADVDVESAVGLLERHRQSQASLLSGELEKIDCPCARCEQRGEERKLVEELSPAQLKEGLILFWPLLEHTKIAEERLGALFSFAKTEEILRLYYDAIIVCLREGKGEESLVQVSVWLREAFFLGLDGFVEVCRRREEEVAAIKEIKIFGETELRSRWREREAYWRAEYLSSGAKSETEDGPSMAVSLAFEQLLDEYGKKIRRTLRGYWGKTSVSLLKERLFGMIEECGEKLRGDWEIRELRVSFRESYAGRSRFSSSFPMARKMKREWLFFAGPTNSGKTHSAFEALAGVGSGVYLAPLRLLAVEGQRELQARGCRASFVTGEEREEVEGAKFVASTIEMANTQKVLGAAVIDEVQMLGHSQRGWAWFQALYGVPAHRLILTGSKDAIPMVRQIAESLHEPLEIRELERFQGLELLSTPSTLDALEPGTAIICFSRRDVLGIKQKIEAGSARRVAVIYGALSPDVRREEARRFRAREADFLVATDAIGMGLNLPIKTVLFWSMEKSSEGLKRVLTTSEINQIAGRAGRYGVEERGFVGAFSEEHLALIAAALGQELPPLEGPFGLMPLFSHLELLSQTLGTTDLSRILRYYQRELWFEEPFFFPYVTDAMMSLAEELEPILKDAPLGLKHTFVCAPISGRSRGLVEELCGLAKDVVEGRPWSLDASLLRPYLHSHTDNDRLMYMAEEQVRRLTLYRWLLYRFPEQFGDGEKADTYRYILDRFIRRSLSKGTPGRRCQRCGIVLRSFSTRTLCTPCYKLGLEEA